MRSRLIGAATYELGEMLKASTKLKDRDPVRREPGDSMSLQMMSRRGSN